MNANLLTRVILKKEKDENVAYISIEGKIENATNEEKIEVKNKLGKAFDHILGFEENIPEDFEQNNINLKGIEKDTINEELYELEVYNSKPIRKLLYERKYVFDDKVKAWRKTFNKSDLRKEKEDLINRISVKNIKIKKKEEKNV